MSANTLSLTLSFLGFSPPLVSIQSSSGGIGKAWKKHEKTKCLPYPAVPKVKSAVGKSPKAFIFLCNKTFGPLGLWVFGARLQSIARNCKACARCQRSGKNDGTGDPTFPGITLGLGSKASRAAGTENCLKRKL